MTAIEPLEVQTDRGVITGLRARPLEPPRALIIALHGAGYDASYWHLDDKPLSSLPLLGRQLGFEVILMNRPGYAGSAQGSPHGQALATQANMIFAAIDQLRSGDRLPFFLIGHSMGGILALHMGAHERGSEIKGIDVSGVPLRFTNAQASMMREVIRPLLAAGATHVPSIGAERRRLTFFGEAGSYDLDAPAQGEGNPIPVVEFIAAQECPEVLPSKLGLITSPVQWTAAASENSQEATPTVVAEAKQLLAKSRYVRTAFQANSGHSISQHHVARAYHLRALAFFEECLASF